MRNTADGLLDAGLSPVGFDKHGPKYRLSDVNAFVLKDVINGTHIPPREKKVTKEIEAATDSIEEAKAKFNRVHTSMMEAESQAVDSAKKASGNIRKAANDLATGLIKVQQTANFNALERQVDLLERAAAALTTLAELDKSGKLESLIKAIK